MRADALIIMRDGVELSARQVRADPAASAARRHVRDFDAFLARHGSPEDARIPEGFTVDLSSSLDNAYGGADSIDLGGPSRSFMRSTALAPDIVGHELVHGIDQRMQIQLGMVDEGWADIVGAAFARDRGYLGAEDWRIGVGTMRARSGGPAHLRHMLDPPIKTIGGLRRRITTAERRPEEQQFSLLDNHHLAGLITRPGALAAAEIGAARIGRIYTDALLHHLPQAMPTALDDAFAAAQRVQDSGGTWPLADIHVAAIRTSAQATLDAARDLPGARRATDALRAGWRRVGISDIA